MSDRLLSLFIRHGATSATVNHQFRGPLNPPLNEEGLQDAQSLKEKFRNFDIGEAYTSDKLRSQQTANILLEPHDIEPIVDKNLDAWNVGYLAGKSKDQHGDEIKFYQDNPDRPIPGGESLNAFKSRVRPSLRHIIQRGYETGVPSIAAVHSSIIHEIGSMLHGNHGEVLVHPGGVVGVFHSQEKGLYAKPLIKPLVKPEGYGS
jgi:broad specificity phosphatase PhoE